MNKEKHLFIENDKRKIYVRSFEVDKGLPNLIFIMTPIDSVKENIVENFLKGLTYKACNVFAMDFPGIGQSEGGSKDISLFEMKYSLLKVIEYIRKEFNNEIHFYGGTGAGGILGQALVSTPEIGNKIKSFIQYGVCVYKDSSILGNPFLMKSLYPILLLLTKIIPAYRVKFKIPPYSGFNALKENQWYLDVMEKSPNAFNFKISLLTTLLSVFYSKKSPIQNSITCPVFVIAAKHDRYYYSDYIERYYTELKSPKKIFWIEGSHISFDWDAEIINKKVLEWVFNNPMN